MHAFAPIGFTYAGLTLLLLSAWAKRVPKVVVSADDKRRMIIGFIVIDLLGFFLCLYAMCLAVL